MTVLERQLEASVAYNAERIRQQRPRDERLWTDEELASVHAQLDLLLLLTLPEVNEALGQSE